MRNYNDMMPAEQAKWIEDFSRLADPIPTEPSEIQQLFQLLSVWPFAERFCNEGLQYGDYMARTYRLPVYIDKVKDMLAEGLVQTDANGKPVAVVAPGAPLRRRGRPTREEAAARPCPFDGIHHRGGSALALGDRRIQSQRKRIFVLYHFDKCH